MKEFALYNYSQSYITKVALVFPLITALRPPQKYNKWHWGLTQKGVELHSRPFEEEYHCRAEFDEFVKYRDSIKGGNMFKEMFGGLKKYVNEHQETIYTIAIALLVDRFVFGGAFQERIKGIVEGFLSKAENKVKGA